MFIFSKKVSPSPTLDKLSVLGPASTKRTNVYLARSKATQRLHALKVIPHAPHDTALKSIAARKETAATEQAFLRLLPTRTPFSAELTGSWQDDINSYLLTSWYSGESLKTVLNKEHTLGVLHTRHITAQLVLYLVALKESRVLHRDLRSANVLLDKEGNVRVTGLGCAKRFRLCSGQDVDHVDFTVDGSCDGASFFRVPQEEAASRTTEVCGAPRSRAPERHQKRAYSYESDLFSVGILMYEMLTGRLPWGEGASVEELADQVSRAPLKFVESDHIGPHARDLLVRLLEKDPSKRIKLDEVVSHKFFRSVNWVRLAKKEVLAPWAPMRAAAPSKAAKQRGFPVGKEYKEGLAATCGFEYRDPATFDKSWSPPPTPGVFEQFGAKVTAALKERKNGVVDKTQTAQSPVGVSVAASVPLATTNVVKVRAPSTPVEVVQHIVVTSPPSTVHKSALRGLPPAFSTPTVPVLSTAKIQKPVPTSVRKPTVGKENIPVLSTGIKKPDDKDTARRPLVNKEPPSPSSFFEFPRLFKSGGGMSSVESLPDPAVPTAKNREANGGGNDADKRMACNNNSGNGADKRMVCNNNSGDGSNGRVPSDNGGASTSDGLGFKVTVLAWLRRMFPPSEALPESVEAPRV